MPAEAIAANTIAGKGFPASNRLWYIRNPKKVATRAAPDPNVTRSNMRPEIRRSLPASVSAGVAETGTRDTSANNSDRGSGTSATDESARTSGTSSWRAGWISTRRESNSFSATVSSTSGDSSTGGSGSVISGGAFERSIRSSRRASTLSVRDASLNE